MSRERKFKAWDKKHKMWLEGFRWPYGHTGLFLDIETGKLVAIEANGENGIHYDEQVFGHVELVEFIGLKDIEGKDIYEKDYDHEGNMIDFCPTCMGYQFFQIDVPTKDIIWCHGCEGNFMLQDHLPEFKSISNYFDNPELLQP